MTSIEDALNGRQPRWKMTSMKDSMEEDLNGRQPQWKKTSMADNLNGRRAWPSSAPACFRDILNIHKYIHIF